MNKLLLLPLLVVSCAAPTEPVPEPPPSPVVAEMTPRQAEIRIGETTTFAMNTAGGRPGDPVTWTCSSSATNIATTTATTQGCEAVGIGPGTAAITAVVSKSATSTTVSTQLTVLPPLDLVNGDEANAWIYVENTEFGHLDVRVQLVGINSPIDVYDVEVELFVGGRALAPFCNTARVHPNVVSSVFSCSTAEESIARITNGIITIDGYTGGWRCVRNYQSTPNIVYLACAIW